jgi:hypothetical protein
VEIGTPFQEDASSAMEKVAAALPSRMRAFLDRLPAVLNVKATPLKKREEQRYRKQIAALLTAVLPARLFNLGEQRSLPLHADKNPLKPS